ncbi:MAG: sugar phosphate isomerase/epimerase [Candidatus Omnitrophica bacterium]|nr:sugar phosphate isomerase/epimerase [Candidatus Omnitrophota bacterium]MCM8802503.1 sugar phosphate isomerase/epimerase [Candidatus Omnitrophota bacterium]
MIKAISLRCFSDSLSWQQCIKKAKYYNYQGIEINFDGDKNLFINCEFKILKEIKRTIDKNNIKVASVYSREQWITPISSKDKEKRKKGKEVLKRLIEIAEFLEAKTVLTIPGVVDNSYLSSEVEIIPYNEVYERAQEIISELAILAEKKGIILAIENVPNKFLLSPLEMKNFIEEIGSKSVGFHFDVANCLYNQGIPEQWIRILNDKIKVIHLKDFKKNIGNLNGFVNIFEGDINWYEFCKALAEIEYNGPLISEVLPPFKFYSEVLIESVSKAIDFLIDTIEKLKHLTKIKNNV